MVDNETNVINKNDERVQKVMNSINTESFVEGNVQINETLFPSTHKYLNVNANIAGETMKLIKKKIPQIKFFYAILQ